MKRVRDEPEGAREISAVMRVTGHVNELKKWPLQVLYLQPLHPMPLLEETQCLPQTVSTTR